MLNRKQVPVVLPPERYDAPPTILWRDPEERVLLALSFPAVPTDHGVEEGPLYSIEPFRENYRRQFKDRSVWALRWSPNLVRVENVRGKAKHGCKSCRSYERRGLIGCWEHTRYQRTTQPDPDAGKVFGTVHSVKLYGLATGTKVFIQIDGDWQAMTVGEYVPWREEARAEEKARQKVRERKRKYAKRPTVADRIWNDPFGLDASEG